MILSDLLRGTKLLLGRRIIGLHHFAHLVDHTVMILVWAKSCRPLLSWIFFHVLLKVRFYHLWLWRNYEWLLVSTIDINIIVVWLEVLRQRRCSWTIISLVSRKCQVDLAHTRLLLNILAIDSRGFELFRHSKSHTWALGYLKPFCVLVSKRILRFLSSILVHYCFVVRCPTSQPSILGRNARVSLSCKVCLTLIRILLIRVGLIVRQTTTSTLRYIRSLVIASRHV